MLAYEEHIQMAHTTLSTNTSFSNGTILNIRRTEYHTQEQPWNDQYRAKGIMNWTEEVTSLSRFLGVDGPWNHARTNKDLFPPILFILLSMKTHPNPRHQSILSCVKLRFWCRQQWLTPDSLRRTSEIYYRIILYSSGYRVSSSFQCIGLDVPPRTKICQPRIF